MPSSPNEPTAAPLPSANVALPRDRPESTGVDPGKIADFLTLLQKEGIPLDSFMLYRHGRVVAETWWWPYTPGEIHMLHSATKSITGTAVGFALAEQLLRLDDPVVSFFPDLAPTPHGNLAAMRIEDLLTMRTGHTAGISGATARLADASWTEQFFAEPVPLPPGTRFTYSSATSHILSAIVQRVSGHTVRDYLSSRLFQPLGIDQLSWDLDRDGVNTGGNGLSLTTEAFLSFGVAHLHDGRWRGRQVLPPGWVRHATLAHVPRVPASTWDGHRFVDVEPRLDDHAHSSITADTPGEGFGYHLWLGQQGSYSAQGMFGQYCIVLPKHDAVVAMTGSIGQWRHRDLPSVIDRHLTPALTPKPRLPINNTASDRLSNLLTDATTEHPIPPPRRTVPPGTRWHYAIDPADNDDGADWIEFEFTADDCTFRQHDREGTHQVRCGLRRWLTSQTSIGGATLHHSYRPPSMKVIATAAWTEKRRLEMTWHFVQTPFLDTVNCRFAGDRITMNRSVNVNSGLLNLPPISGIRFSNYAIPRSG